MPNPNESEEEKKSKRRNIATLIALWKNAEQSQTKEEERQPQTQSQSNEEERQPQTQSQSNIEERVVGQAVKQTIEKTVSNAIEEDIRNKVIRDKIIADLIKQAIKDLKTKNTVEGDGPIDKNVPSAQKSKNSLKKYMRKLREKHLNDLLKEIEKIYGSFKLNYLITFKEFKSKLESLPDVIKENNKEYFRVIMLTFLGKLLVFTRNKTDTKDVLMVLNELNYIDYMCGQNGESLNVLKNYIDNTILKKDGVEITDEIIRNLNKLIIDANNKKENCQIKPIFGENSNFNSIKKAIELARDNESYVTQNNDVIRCVLEFFYFYDDFSISVNDSEFLTKLTKYYDDIINPKELSIMYYLHNYFDIDSE